MTDKNILPDWYPAEIHKKRLSLGSWAEELKARSFVFELLRDPRIKLEELSKGFISEQFIGFIIEGNREEHNVPTQAPPLFYIPPADGAEDGKWSYNFTPSQFGRGLMFPLMVNIDYDDKLLEVEFKSWLHHTKKLIKSGEYQKSLFDLMFEGEDFYNTFIPSNQSKGKTPYTEAQTHDWFRFKVLDWIDLKLWGIVMDVEYSPSFLKELFYQSNIDGSSSNLRTTIKWAHELLNRLTYDQITASISQDNISSYHDFTYKSTYEK